MLWSPRSPDLNSIDLFLHGFFKNEAYHIEKENIDELRELVNTAVNNLMEQQKGGIFELPGNWIRRVQACLQENGDNFEQLW